MLPCFSLPIPQPNTWIQFLLFRFSLINFFIFTRFAYRHRVVVTEQWFDSYFPKFYFPIVTGLWWQNIGLIFIRLLYLIWVWWSNICFNHIYECLLLSYFFLSCSFIFSHFFFIYIYSWWLGSLIVGCLWMVIETVFSFIFKRIGHIYACIMIGTGLEEIAYI